MAYLSGTTITIDAVLTKKGREKLSKGNFKITKFALSDDEIDYSLYNPAHPSGSEYYGLPIENLPLLESIVDESKLLKYKLITLPKGTAQIPLISIGVSSITLIAPIGNSQGQSFIVSPSTINGLNSSAGYTATLNDSRFVMLTVKDAVVTTGNIRDDRSVLNNNIETSNRQPSTPTINATTVVGKSFVLTSRALPPNVSMQEATLTIYGNETGGSIIIPIKIISNLNSTEPTT